VISDGDSSEKEEVRKRNELPRGTPYSADEDIAMLKYVCSSNNTSRIKGSKMWDEAYRDNICPGRSTVSMRSRFLKYVVPEIEKFDVTEEDIKKLKASMKKKYTRKKTSKNSCRPQQESPA
jgi:hypothetical protein